MFSQGKQSNILTAYYLIDGKREAGCDEAGRGPLAGDLFAAAVILGEEGNKIQGLNDSKKLSAKNRDSLRIEIEQRAQAWAVSRVSIKEIDELNILRASILGMHRAIASLHLAPDRLLIDGNRFYPYRNIEYYCIVKGDATYKSIAAASILAKTYRDDYMKALHQEYPQYGWDRNNGYPTKAHFAAIDKFGITPYHRQTFLKKRPVIKSLFDELPC